MAYYNRSDVSLFANINSSILPSSYYDNNNTLHRSSDSGKTSISERLKFVERLTTHITLIVSIIGLIGNACTIIVLNRQSMRKWRSSILLSSLAAVDFLYLLIIFLSIIDELTNKAIGLNQSLILCQVTVYITHVCSFLSANFTLSFTLQRFIAVIFPLHAKTIISNRSSITNISVLLIFGCSFYSFSFFVTNVSDGKCLEDDAYPVLFPLLMVDICLTFIIPFIFIVIFNCAIVYQLQHRKKFPTFSDTKQLEKAIFQIFIETSNILQNTTQDVFFFNDYYNNSNQYRQIKTIRTNDGQFIGNSLFANYLVNKLVLPTKTTCETIININEEKLEKSICISITANLLTIHRQLSFDSKIDNQTFIFKSKNLSATQLKTKTKNDFDHLLKQICTKSEFNSQYQLINMMNNELNNEDLNKILFLNTNQYSNCEWTIINQSIIDVNRYQATDYIFKNFYHDESIIEHHLDFIERKSNDHIKQILKKYFPNSCQITNIITLRMLILISQDNLTIQCILNRNNSLKYRAIAFRFLNNEKKFFKDFQNILINEEESSEMRILCFQAIYLSLNISEINNLIENVKSNQLRFYIKSLFKQSSIWLANSGSYKFPFGKMNIIFDENLLFYFPNMIQLELGNNTDIDFYFIRNNQQNIQYEILLIFDRKNIMRFSTIKDFFNWINNDRLFEMKTLDEFCLKINLKTDFNLKWLTGYFNQFDNFFKK
ncbi:unnamed protein product [Rotaria sp. Silwood1]|nr:unnamed protein product [Rotaria sp. Silwood1]